MPDKLKNSNQTKQSDQNKADNNSTTKVIDEGYFYFIYDGSKKGHPGLIVWKDEFHNLYLAIKFGTTKNKENVLFKYPIGGKAKQSYVYKRFFLIKRKDISKTRFLDLRIKDSDLNDLLDKMDGKTQNIQRELVVEISIFSRETLKKPFLTRAIVRPIGPCLTLLIYKLTQE